MNLDTFKDEIVRKMRNIYLFIKEDEIKYVLKDFSLSKPFSIFYVFDAVYEHYKDKTSNSEDKAKLELAKLAFESSKKTLDFLKINYKNNGINKEVIEDEAELIDSFKSSEWEDYIPANVAIVEFKKRFSSLLEKYDYHSDYFNILFDRLLIKETKNNPKILELDILKETKEFKKYLYEVAALSETEDSIDKKPLADYYINPQTTKVEVKLHKENKWNIYELLNASQKRWYEVIVSDFGTGKSSYAYYIASQLAKEHLKGKSIYVPILIKLNISRPENSFANVYGQMTLDDLLQLIGEKCCVE